MHVNYEQIAYKFKNLVQKNKFSTHFGEPKKFGTCSTGDCPKMGIGTDKIANLANCGPKNCIRFKFRIFHRTADRTLYFGHLKRKYMKIEFIINEKGI